MAKLALRMTLLDTCDELRALNTLKSGAADADRHAAISPEFLSSALDPRSPQIVGASAVRKQKVFE